MGAYVSMTTKHRESVIRTRRGSISQDFAYGVARIVWQVVVIADASFMDTLLCRLRHPTLLP